MRLADHDHQADRTRELSDQDVALGVGLRLPLGVPEGARLLDVLSDLGKAAAVRGLGALVENIERPSASSQTASVSCSRKVGSEQSRRSYHGLAAM
jgi:hypothetical protein